MQTLKHYFYLSSLFLSGGALVAMTLLILAQVVARSLGIVIPSSEDFAAWLLSATVFFGLAYTFNTGGHIRVSILLSRLGETKRHYFEVFNLVIGLFITGFIMYYTAFTVYDSFSYDEVTDTYLAVPLWLVQLPMAIGSLFLFIAVIDNFIIAIKGGSPEYLSHEDELGKTE